MCGVSQLARQIDYLDAVSGSVLAACEARGTGLLPDRYLLFICVVCHRDAWAATLPGLLLEKVPGRATWAALLAVEQ